MLSNINSQRKRLVVFNLATDLDNYLLSHAHDWVNEFSYHFETVEVISTHTGRVVLGENVELFELGGGSTAKRIRALSRLFPHFCRILRNRNQTVVFHHMSSMTLALLGWPLRLIGVPQGVWYAHSKVDPYLKIGINSSQMIFTPHKSALNLPKKHTIIATGHGVKFPPKPRLHISNKKRHSVDFLKISVLGRVSRVKRIELLIGSIEELRKERDVRLEVDIVGPIQDQPYFIEIMDYAERSKTKVNYLGVKVNEDLEQYLIRSSDLMYNGMQGSIDKAPLLAASLGVPVVTTNLGLQSLTGMTRVLKTSFERRDLRKQIEHLVNLPARELLELRECIMAEVRRNNDIEETIKVISNHLKKWPN